MIKWRYPRSEGVPQWGTLQLDLLGEPQMEDIRSMLLQKDPKNRNSNAHAYDMDITYVTP